MRHQTTVEDIRSSFNIEMVEIETEAAVLRLKYDGCKSGQHPEYPVWQWIRAVSEFRTRLGYWQWIANAQSSKQVEPKP